MRSRVSAPLLFGLLIFSLLFARQTRSSTGCVTCPAPLTPVAAVAAADPRASIHSQVLDEEAREKGVFLPVLARGDSKSREIALTFDDGPHPAWTPKLLDLLKSLHVKATFFLVGKMVDRYPSLAVREVAEGHELANHTYNHPNLTKLDDAHVDAELRTGAEAINRAVGYSPVFFRPPGGQYNSATLRCARQLKLTPVLWTANSKDFMHPSAQTVENRLLAAPFGGGILLCHDGIEETMRILPDFINRLRSQGYTFVTVSELARHAERGRSL